MLFKSNQGQFLFIKEGLVEIMRITKQIDEDGQNKRDYKLFFKLTSHDSSYAWFIDNEMGKQIEEWIKKQ